MHLCRRLLVSLSPLVLGACGRGDLVLPNEGQPANVEYVSGNTQTGTILEPAADSLVVKVTDPFRNPIPGIEIAWSADGGGEVQPAPLRSTGNDGQAATQRILGEQPGSYGTTAVAPSLPEDVVTFTTTAVAAKLVLVTQPGADRVVRRGHRSAARAPAPGSGGERAGAGRCLGHRSDRLGRRQPAGHDYADERRQRQGDLHRSARSSGAPGARTLIFAASGYAPAMSTPVSLGVGAPASVAIAAGDGQSAAGATSGAARPAVLVRDAGGTPVASVAVTFAVVSGGGSVEGGNATTGADGVATVGSWTLGEHARRQHAHRHRSGRGRLAAIRSPSPPPPRPARPAETGARSPPRRGPSRRPPDRSPAPSLSWCATAAAIRSPARRSRSPRPASA